MNNCDFLKKLNLTDDFEPTKNLSENNFDFIKDAVNCFALSKDFQQKRFQRYVEKVKVIIFDYMKNFLFTSDISDLTLLMQYLFESVYCKKFIDYIKENEVTEEIKEEFFLDNTFDDFKELAENREKTGEIFCKLLHNTEIEPTILGCQQFIGIIRLVSPHTPEDAFKASVPRMKEIISNCIKDACARFIRIKYLQGLLDKDTFFKYVPETDLEKFMFIEGLVNDIDRDITNAYITNAKQYDEYIEPFQSNVYKEQDKKMQSIKEENDKLKIDIVEKNKEIKNLEKDNNLLKEKLSSIQKNPEIKRLQNKIKEVAHEKEKILKDYKHISGKYEKLKELQINVDVFPDEAEKTFKEVDCNLNYLFVVDTSKLKLNNSIKEVFPNAIFYDSFVNIQNMKLDMVICMTSLIDHVQYKKFKSQCKTKGVQFLHCNCQNPQMIKEEIWKLINKESV